MRRVKRVTVGVFATFVLFFAVGAPVAAADSTSTTGIGNTCC